MPSAKQIAIGVACVAVAGFAGFRVTAWARGGPASECRRKFSPDARGACYQRFLREPAGQLRRGECRADADTLIAFDRDVSAGGSRLRARHRIEAYGRYPTSVSTFTACGEAAVGQGAVTDSFQATLIPRPHGDPPMFSRSWPACSKAPGSSRWILFNASQAWPRFDDVHEHDLPRALTSCDQLLDTLGPRICLCGAFMESDMSAIAPHHPATELPPLSTP